MSIDQKMEKMKCSFLRLTALNQQYVLGLVEGMKLVQNRNQREQLKIINQEIENIQKCEYINKKIQ